MLYFIWFIFSVDSVHEFGLYKIIIILIKTKVLSCGICLPVCAMAGFQSSMYRYYSISQEICNGFVVLCFVVVMQSFIINSHEVFIHIHQGCFAGTGVIVKYGKISQCITTTKHSKAKTVCIFLGIYCTWHPTHECTWIYRIVVYFSELNIYYNTAFQLSPWSAYC